MKLRLADNTELYPIIVTGAKKNAHNITRDALTFVFGANNKMDEIDAAFTEYNCETITLIELNEENEIVSEDVHKGYVIRTELVKKSVIVKPETPESEEVTEERITITMAQRTYAESKIASIADEVTSTQLALCEVYEMIG